METVEKAALKLLEAVRVLHERGYELIRIFPYDAPSGCYWRCTISAKRTLIRNTGSFLRKIQVKILCIIQLEPYMSILRAMTENTPQ